VGVEMLYTEYNTLSTDELLRLVFNNTKVDDLALELALRLESIEEQLAESNAEIRRIGDDISDIESIVLSLEQRVSTYS
jgi:hypothetical protein